eukprot:7376138-Prymnesium_polylepis.2
MEPVRRAQEQERELVLWLVERIGRPAHQRHAVSTDSELAARWRAEVKAVAGDESWPDDFQAQGIMYLRFCVPRQIVTRQPWPQMWMVRADGEWQHEDWQHQWPEGSMRWSTEWWTVEQLEQHFQRLALVGCVVQPSRSS